MGQMESAAALRRKQEQDNYNRFKGKSRDRLTNIMKQKMTTALIGFIARIEEYIGKDLWGHGRKEKTPEEKKWFDIWEKCRADVLTHGNNQIRSMRNEMEQYIVDWVGFEYKKPIIGRNNNV